MWSLFTALHLGVGLWVVVLFENSIVCHLMKQTLFVYEHEREHGHQIVVVGVCCLLLFCWFLCFLPVSFFVCFFGEFDPGSGRTLAACLTHASRTERPPLFWWGCSSGERVSNTWVICPVLRDKLGKLGLIPDRTMV